MIDLQIPDERDAKFDLIRQLATAEALPPVYVISHRRAATLPTLRTIPALRGFASVVVADEEWSEYRAHGLAYPNLLPIPRNYRGHGLGVGRARQFCLDTADLLGQDRVIVMDDDLVSLNILYGTPEGKASRAYRDAIETSREEFFLGVLGLFAAAGEDAFTKRPDAMIASPQNQNANRTLKASSVRWQTNNGGNPGLIQLWAVDRFTDRVGSIDLDLFNRHGDDVGAVVQIIEAGGEAVKVPSIIGDSWDCETQSVIRDAATAPGLRQEEHDALMSTSLAPYIKTKRDLVDRPQWHSLDWRRLAAAGRVAQDQDLWIDA